VVLADVVTVDAELVDVFADVVEHGPDARTVERTPGERKVSRPPQSSGVYPRFGDSHFSASASVQPLRAA
jgi:hypothetical protein